MPSIERSAAAISIRGPPRGANQKAKTPMAANMATTIQRSRVMRERGFIVGQDSREGLPKEVTLERLGIKRSRGKRFSGTDREGER